MDENPETQLSLDTHALWMAAPAAMAVVAADGAIRLANEAFASLTGQSSSAHVQFAAVFDPRDHMSADGFLRGGTTTLRARLSNSLREVELVGKSVGDAGDMLILVRDDQERSRLDQGRRNLTHELSHRTKNLLTVVQVLARQIAPSAEGNFESAFSARLAGLAASHDLLAESAWNGADLHALVRAQVRASGWSARTLFAEGPVLKLKSAVVQNFGMALFEMASFAGAGGIGGASVGDILWSLDDDRFVFEWRCRMDARPMSSFGRSVICDMLSYALSGDSSLANEEKSVVWRLSAPGSCFERSLNVAAG